LNKAKNRNYLVAVIGAGPAGLYASQYLARQGVEVVLFNREIKPGGLVEYGIYPSKHKLRKGLLAQFRKILEMPNVHYLGNILVGQNGDISLEHLRQLGFDAFMVTTGAQVNTKLNLPGEDLEGVYHAHDIVFYYNRLPKHTYKAMYFGSNVAIIGVGNVMLDIVHYFKQRNQSYSITAYARRGPTEVKFDNKSLEPVVECLDCQAIRDAVDEARSEVEKVGKDIEEFYSIVEKARKRAEDCHSKIKFQMKFLYSPKEIIGDDEGRVKAIRFERNELVQEGNRVNPKGTGEMVVVPVDTVVFSIGSRVDAGFGLPVAHGNFITTSNPRFPIDGISYEVYNEDLCSTCDDVFVSGWARVAGEGVVGLARKDAERGARALLQFLDSVEPRTNNDILGVLGSLSTIEKPIVTIEGLQKLWAAEEKIAAEKELLEFKFDTQEEMLKVIRES
jgi:ferredoxin--NADP+ reductase